MHANASFGADGSLGFDPGDLRRSQGRRIDTPACRPSGAAAQGHVKRAWRDPENHQATYIKYIIIVYNHIYMYYLYKGYTVLFL